MGRMFEATAQRLGIGISERFMEERPFGSEPSVRDSLKQTAVLVDFSSGDAVPNNVRHACRLGIPMVEGTTGWQHRLEDVKREVEAAGIGFVYASNFSLGVNLFYAIVERAAALFGRYPQYDPFIEESHHKQKKDAPSGTALVLRSFLQPHYPGASIPVTSVRAGFMPGQHAVSFDSTCDTVRLEHTARNREGLAEGAVLAARWIVGKKGLYHFRDIVDQLV